MWQTVWTWSDATFYGVYLVYTVCKGLSVLILGVIMVILNFISLGCCYQRVTEKTKGGGRKITERGRWKNKKGRRSNKTKRGTGMVLFRDKNHWEWNVISRFKHFRRYFILYFTVFFVGPTIFICSETISCLDMPGPLAHLTADPELAGSSPSSAT